MRPSTPGRRSLDPEPAEHGSGSLAAVLSALLPGLGQLYRGRWLRGAALAVAPVGALAAVAALALGVDLVAGALVRSAQLVVAIAFGGGLVYHLAAIGDAFVGRRGPGGLAGRRPREYLALALVVLVLVATYGTVYRQSSAWAGLATKLFTPAGAPPRAAAGPSQAALTPPPAWSGTERLNVLVLGIDSRGPTDADLNTDTMIVLTLDPLNRTAGMLSIPRDVYIDRPGVFKEKINAAYAFGGPDLSRRLVEDLLGLTIHGYGLLDFEAFTKIVDAAGGVQVDVKRPLRDEAYPTAAFGVQRLSILAGPQLMRGETALRYARTRHGSTDYDRAARQQDVIGALRARLAGGDLLLRLPAIMDQVGPAVRTSFDPANALPVARLGSAIDRGAIRADVLYPCGGDFAHCELKEQNDPGGFYLFPVPARVADLVAQLFYDPRVKQEAALVEVRGAGVKKEVATGVSERIAARAYTVLATTEAPAGRTAVLVRNQAKRHTADALAAQLGLKGATPLPAGDATGADVVAVIGTDYRGLASDLGR